MTRYELLDRIGVGGMAEIFRGKAVAAGGFEKPVAIKRILPHLSQDKRFVELLIAEAKILSLLKHRNIVQIFDVGLGDDGQYFLVMEYVDGKDIGAVQKAQEMKRKRFPFDLALHVGAEICEALEHAHVAKAPDGKPMSLVHRDVSPSNVLLSRAGECKLTDFGIAKRAEQEQTGTGGVRGKFAYISPEQARNEHIEPRSDVFSVAILIWELVTGRRLFSGMADLEALRAVRDANVQRPTDIDGRLHPDVDRILMSALQRDPKRRPTAAQLGEQLRSLRYSLETSVGDPATELARIIDDAEKAARESRQIEAMPFEHIDSMGGEHTVIRIRTADAFSTKDNRGMAAARQVIDHFEEEQTRQAQLSGDQLRMLRGARRDSSELSAPPMPRGRQRRETDEPTTTRPPFLSEDSSPTLGGDNPFDGDEATRLVAPTSRRTPPPERTRPKSTAPPSLPGMTAAKGKTAPPPMAQELPSTIHQRNPRLQSIGGPPPMPGGPPPMPAGMEMAPPTLADEAPGTMHQRNPRSGLPTDPRARALPPAAQPVPTPPTEIYRPPPQPVAPEPYSRSQPSLSQPSHSQPSHSMPSQSQSHSQSQSMRPVHQTPMPMPVQQPMLPTPMPQQPQPMMQPPMLPTPMPQQGNYPAWGAQPHRPSVPPPQLQQQYGGAPKAGGLQPWMLVVGALVMAALAFAITRAFISG